MKSDLGEAGYQLTTADWLRANSTDDLPALKKFVAAGFPTDTCDAAGDSALHAAAAAGARNAVDFLLGHGLAIDLPGANARTPLMAAVLSKQTEMVRWLLRQGANPRSRDKDGYAPLMLAVREGASGAVAELAPYHRDSLDSAILLAALVGRPEAIDTLTNYGASVYARMEDGRTPLMIAAENGHAAAVDLLLDIGASRFSTDSGGRTAADLATSAGHAEIAATISRTPLPQELALESPAEVASAMDAFVDAAAAKTTADSATAVAATPEAGAPVSSPAKTRSPSRPIQGEVLSAAVRAPAPAGQSALATEKNEPPSFPLPPLVMRHYRERDLPVELRSVEGETATLGIRSTRRQVLSVRPGETIPGSRLVVLRMRRRMEDSKLNLGQPMEVSVMEVRDSTTGETREWISGVPSTAHDPLALIEDAATGRRYTATTGQRFKSADGAEFIVSDVRPNQIVIEDAATGAVQTIPLRGPRG
ncbi:MAG: ankyrin repeat domain-containing protein [Luteolibacter sp.]|nr:ankyrin repeat domain-containing protein [Luteolibacter sp.]